MASKYPLPANYQFSVRSLDEFTQTMLLSDILRKIDSLPFKAFDMLSSSAVHRMPGGAGLPRMVGNFTHSGVSLLLIAQLVAVALIIAIVMYFVAMSTFGVRKRYRIIIREQNKIRTKNWSRLFNTCRSSSNLKPFFRMNLRLYLLRFRKKQRLLRTRVRRI